MSRITPIGFLGLPAELRQQILLLALPSIIEVTFPGSSPVVDYVLVCKQFKQDLAAAGSLYEPEYIVTKGHDLRLLRKAPSIGQIQHLSLHIFSSLSLAKLLDQASTWGEQDPIDEVLSAWSYHLAAPRNALPKTGLKSIRIDITPVPGYARDRKIEFLAWLVNHPETSNRTWNLHDTQVAELVQSTGTWLKITAQRQQPKYEIVGTISEKSWVRMPGVHQAVRRLQDEGINIRFEPRFLDDSSVLKWEVVVELFDLVRRRTQDPRLQQSRKDVAQRMRRLFEQNRRLRSLFRKNAVEDGPWTQAAVLKIAAVATTQNVIERWNEDYGVKSHTQERVPPLKRALLHQLSHALGLRSESTNEWRSENGVVYKSVTIAALRTNPNHAVELSENDLMNPDSEVESG